MPTVTDRVILRSSPSGSGYELEVQSPRGFAPAGLPVWLQLGPLQLRAPRESSTVGEYGLVFSLSREQLDGVPDGAELLLLASARGKGRSLGRLDKAALEIR